MPVDVQTTLRRALMTLQTERDRIDRQIAAIEAVLEAGAAGRRTRSAKAAKTVKPKTARKGRRPFTEAEREATRQRMKGYWAERKKVEQKGK